MGTPSGPASADEISSTSAANRARNSAAPAGDMVAIATDANALR